MLVGREPAARYSLHRGYLDALWTVGATPVVLVPPPGGDPRRSLEAIQQADAVLLTGGGDVHPSCYAATPDAALMDVDPDRDAFEVAAVRWATGTGRRVLGICRGAQVINVALGGTLVQDLPTAGLPGHWRLDQEHDEVHIVSADPGSAAEHALSGADRVNSVHHQAVLTAAPGLRVTARSSDGVAEAIEGDGVLGLQWHPERLAGTRRNYLSPFTWLVAG